MEKNKSSYTPILIAVLIIAAFLIGMLWTRVQYLEKGGTATPTKTATSPTIPPAGFGDASLVEKLKKEDHVRGNRNARLLLIEYSDLECPFCKQFHKTAQQIVDSYKGQVAWVYRHFPLDQIHSKADKEAEAAECAGELLGNDGFWKMADKIFEVTPSNNGLDLNSLPDLAAEIGLDKNKFKTCLDSGKMAKHVEEDYQSGIKAGITGTPGNILLDTKTGKTQLIPGALPFDQFKPIIDELLSS
ncbi:MAG: thioredoxin domain-containing protein [Candidatus Levybacteria bacterium]|nr:thioredoxin domain-containing protein [Candidatus Levybacteria bacterium]